MQKRERHTHGGEHSHLEGPGTKSDSSQTTAVGATLGLRCPRVVAHGWGGMVTLGKRAGSVWGMNLAAEKRCMKAWLTLSSR